MANVLKMAIVEAIYSLRAAGLSCREIAKRLGIHRETVSRHLRLQHRSGLKPAITPIMPAGSPASPALAGFEAPTGASMAGRASTAAPWLEWMLEQHAKDLSTKRIHQDLVAEFPGASGVSYDSVRRLLKKLGAVLSPPFRRMECPPGHEAQIDFGTGAPIIGPDGRRRRTHVFRIVLSHSRKAYSEAVFTQSADTFLQCIENALEYFGGVPRTLVVDNLKAAVLHADWFDPELNPKLADFCRHYGTVVLPTRPRTPRHKGKIERGIGYVQGNALKGNSFASLAEENDHLLSWEDRIADRRIHGTTKRQVLAVFNEYERPTLLPLPATRFENFREVKRKVSRDGHVEVEKAFYSVPPEYLGRDVWARSNGRVVRIFNQKMAEIAIHAKHDHGRFSTSMNHVHPMKINGLERGIAYLLGKVRPIGPHSHTWAQAVVTARGVEGHRVVQGLLSLTRKHTCAQLETACETALSYQCYRLRTLRQLIGRAAQKQKPLEFLSEHPLIRPLDDYAAVVARAIQRRQDRPDMDEGVGRHGRGIPVTATELRSADTNSHGIPPATSPDPLP